jgi:ABC-2 type transport system permease protein
MGDIAHGVVRVISFLGKELREVVRRPGALFSLVLGPFLIMFLFGLGYSGFREPFAAEIVIPAEATLPRDQEYYADLAPGRIEVVRISDDAEAAEERLRRREIDILVVAPADAPQQLRGGRQASIHVSWNQVDPSNDALSQAATSIMVSTLNAEIIEQAAEAGIAFAEGELGPAVGNIPADVVARPTRAETENLAPTEPRVQWFFGAAVFALVIQHLCITLTGLSLIRERFSGQLDRYRVAPVGASEILIGKYVAYGVLSLVVALLVTVLLVTVLEVPILGGWGPFAGIVLLLTFASLGLGLVISLVADSERQAVQLSMLILLASVFFSGFVLPVADFAEWMQPLAYLLPVTHGIAALQDTMLRGSVHDGWMLLALAVMGIALYVVAVLRLRSLLRGVG